MSDQLTFDFAQGVTTPKRPRRRVARRAAASYVQLVLPFVALAVAAVAQAAPVVVVVSAPQAPVVLAPQAPAAVAPSFNEGLVAPAGLLSRLAGRARLLGATVVAILLAVVADAILARAARFATDRQNDDSPAWYDRPRHRPPPTGGALRAPRYPAQADHPGRGATDRLAQNNTPNGELNR